MIKIGVISGDGNLPIYIGNVLTKKNFDITYFLLNSVKNKKIYNKEKYKDINILSIKKLIDILKKNNIENIIFAGSIKRPSIKDIGFDLQTLKLAKKLLLEKKGDNKLLISIKNYLEENGFTFFDWKQFCPEIFSFEKNLSKIKPSNHAIKSCNSKLTKS